MNFDARVAAALVLETETSAPRLTASIVPQLSIADRQALSQLLSRDSPQQPPIRGSEKTATNDGANAETGEGENNAADQAGSVDVDSEVEELKKEKSYLFDLAEGVVAASKTSGVKDKKSGGLRSLEVAAKRAATSGNRVDVQEYLRVRRQFV